MLYNDDFIPFVKPLIIKVPLIPLSKNYWNVVTSRESLQFCEKESKKLDLDKMKLAIMEKFLSFGHSKKPTAINSWFLLDVIGFPVAFYDPFYFVLSPKMSIERNFQHLLPWTCLSLILWMVDVENLLSLPERFFFHYYLYQLNLTTFKYIQYYTYLKFKLWNHLCWGIQ